MFTLTTLVFILASTIDELHGANWKNEDNCGLAFTNRIVGGKSAQNGKYPWLVRLGYETAIKGRYLFLCGGTLASKTIVITAAHCIDTDRKLRVVHVGETQITCPRTPCDDKRVQEIVVKKSIAHEKFEKPTGYSDIAVVQLSEPVKFTEWVKPICLPNQLGKVGDKGIVAGWGMTNSDTRERPGGLMELGMETIPGSKCKEYFPKSDFNSKNFICGGGKNGEDTCGGDSGGPLMQILNLGNAPRMYLTGVISFGSTNCGVGVPGIYTAIPYHLDWIVKHAQ